MEIRRIFNKLDGVQVVMPYGDSSKVVLLASKKDLKQKAFDAALKDTKYSVQSFTAPKKAKQPRS